MKEIACPGIVPPQRLRAQTGAPAKQPRGQNAGIVENNQLVAAQNFRQFPELTIFPRTAGAIEQEHARGIALVERMLRDSLRRQIVIELAQFHF